ncbi:MAG: Flp pilus assembly complex ATPase component, partial [Verrucomicrobiota bacterium]
SPYELDRKVRRENNLPSLRDSGLKLLKEGKADLASLRKVMDLTYDDKV